METESIKLDVHVKALSQPRSLGFLSTVVISQYREVEEFLINDKDDCVTSLGSYPDDSSTCHDPLISLTLPSFKPNDVYQHLQTQLHDHDLSEQISCKIVEAQQRQTSQSVYLPQQPPLFIIVSVKLTHKVYVVVPPLATDLDQEMSQGEEEESKTCAICLEELSTSDDYCEMPNCTHCFHEPCLTQWLIRDNNSCPLCRKPVDKQPESN